MGPETSKKKIAIVKLVRQHGCDGTISVAYELDDTQNPNQESAKKFEHYVPHQGRIEFSHGETEKEIEVEIMSENLNEESDVYFNVKLSDAQPEGCKLSKKDTCQVNIIGEDETENAVKDIEKIILLMQKQDKVSYLGQFKKAIMLHPQVDEEGNIDDITSMEALMHFLSIFWKVLFAFVPPARWLKGWVSFVVALAFIGLVTAIVGEVASLFGCVCGLKPAVTAITFVALGTSLPDTFASKTAAQESSNADSAVGNVTGSNSVNVFLGLGLPWTIASIYYKIKDDPYSVPAGDLSFSVILFLVTSVLTLVTLIVRRFIAGGELGGNVIIKWISFVWLICLWLVYVVFSTLKVYEVI